MEHRHPGAGAGAGGPLPAARETRRTRCRTSSSITGCAWARRTWRALFARSFPERALAAGDGRHGGAGARRSGSARTRGCSARGRSPRCARASPFPGGPRPGTRLDPVTRPVTDPGRLTPPPPPPEARAATSVTMQVAPPPGTRDASAHHAGGPPRRRAHGHAARLRAPPSTCSCRARDAPAARRKLGEMLVAAGKLSEAQLKGALERQKRTGGTLGELLVAEGLVIRGGRGARPQRAGAASPSSRTRCCAPCRCPRRCWRCCRWRRPSASRRCRWRSQAKELVCAMREPREPGPAGRAEVPHRLPRARASTPPRAPSAAPSAASTGAMTRTRGARLVQHDAGARLGGADGRHARRQAHPHARAPAGRVRLRGDPRRPASRRRRGRAGARAASRARPAALAGAHACWWCRTTRSSGRRRVRLLTRQGVAAAGSTAPRTRRRRWRSAAPRWRWWPRTRSRTRPRWWRG